MKKVALTSVLALCLSSVFYFISCQKETVSDPAKTETSQQENLRATDRGPLILGTVSTYCTCQQGRTCSAWAYTTVKRNAVKVVLDPVTHAYYNGSGPGLRYRIYSGGGCGGTLIADFYCNQSTVQYANTLLANGGTYSLRISYGSSSSPCYAFTNGSCNGQRCIAEEQ